MIVPDNTNTIFQLAASFVNNTSKHIFLTGKAGTGKTTFLKYIQQHTSKNAVVVAPTGVAAINAGGVTIHSLFQLPLGPFIPYDPEHFSLSVQSEHINNAENLIRKIHLSKTKVELLRNLELLIIDEISMVRADTLDALDVVLRHVRRNGYQPFGGVQVLYIGDLFQLPPVVPDDQWQLLSAHYSSAFFFHAKVMKEAPALYIELKKIYRQKDQQFIDVLNRVRNNTVTTNDLQLLNARYQPDFKSTAEDPYIVLSTHNRKVEVMNADELDKLPQKLHRFEAVIEKEFPANAYPADKTLCLKEGAQVVFTKNDLEKRYYNGKLGRVTRIKEAKIFIQCEGAEDEVELSKETWKNIRYTFDQNKNRIVEEELGTFIQYPVRLAWAITIHKSQGLTFTKAIIDAGASFAAGQVYVALSRCVSMEGMVLRSLIHRHCIKTDEKVIAFANSEAALDQLQELLSQEQVASQWDILIKRFDLSQLLTMLESLQEMPILKIPHEKEASTKIINELLVKIRELNEVCRKFRTQLQPLARIAVAGDEQIKERMAKANDYFSTQLHTHCIAPLRYHKKSLSSKVNSRKYAKKLEELEDIVMKTITTQQEVLKTQ